MVRNATTIDEREQLAFRLDPDMKRRFHSICIGTGTTMQEKLETFVKRAVERGERG